MANIKIIDLPTGSPESTSFFEATQVDEQAESGRASVKLALNAFGNFVAGQGASPLEYGDLETESTTLIGGINELHDSIGADAYDDTATYAEGELCIYNNTLYVCTASGGITTPEAWTDAHWTDTTIETLLNTKQNSTDNSLSTVDKTIVGSINEVNSNKANKSDVDKNTVTITRRPGVPNTVPILTSYRKGHVVIIVFAHELPAGTYQAANNGGTWEITPKPIYQTFSMVSCNGTPTVTVRTDGTLGFNGTLTLNAATYAIGELVFVTAN